MVGFCGKRPLHVRVEDNDIGVAADGDRALFREQAEQLGTGRRDDIHELVQGNAALLHALGIQNREPVLDRRTAVRDFGEIAKAQVLLSLEVEGALVGADRLQTAVPE
ncbi:hypothetical protein D3C71_1361210 [compost metagenome]